MKLLFCSGKFESGKTTLTENLYDYKELQKKYMVLKYALADYPKEVFAEVLGKDCQYFNKDKQAKTEYLVPGKEATYLNKRQLMQYLFEDIMCGLDPNIWSKKVCRQIIVNQSRYKKYNECLHIISDWRKLSEYNYLLENLKDTIEDFKTIRINNLNKNSCNTHISETNLDNFNFDYTINVADLTPEQSLLEVINQFKIWGW